MNKAHLHWLFTLFLWGLAFSLSAQNLIINEFMASNGTTIADENGAFDDWVEIYNPNGLAIDVGGMYFTDDLTDLTAWQIPINASSETTIPSGGYKIFWFDKEPEQGALHIDLKLGSGGEDLALIATNGSTIIDSYTFGPQTLDVSEGRSPNGTGGFAFFNNPTPGEANGAPGGGTVEAPTASVSSGLYTSSFTVALGTPTPNATIYYTLDGSVPDESDILYTGAFSVSSTTNLRARAFAIGLTASNTNTYSYLFNIAHTFAIVSMTGDPVAFFDEEVGIYPNFEEDIEIPAHVDFFEPNGTLGFSQLIETEIQGTASAVLPQKSLAIKAKASFGSDVLDHPVFPGSGISQYRSLVCRNSGQDWNITMFRDAMVSSLVRTVDDVNDIISPPRMYLQDFRPGVLYINGEYYGIQNIRERIDSRYLKVNFNLDDNEVDFIENKNEVREGDLVEWNMLEDFLENNNFSNQSNYNQLASMVDVEDYIDHITFNVFVDNADWPGNNNRRWRKRVADAKWRYVVFDLDFTFGLFVEGEPWNSGSFNANSLDRLINGLGFSWPNPDWGTLLFRKLIQNDGWRTDFINRMADQLNVVYSPNRINNRITEFQTVYQSEIQNHADRWTGGFINWQPNIDKLRNFANGRADKVREHFISGFGDVTGTADVTINVSPSNGGKVLFSTLNLEQNNLPFSGEYFMGVDIPATAIAAPGFEFVGWSVSSMGNNATSSINLNGNTTITAIFQTSTGGSDPIIINEINYNSPDAPNSGDWLEFYNPNNNSVNISAWTFRDETGSFPFPPGTSIPANGYLVLVESSGEFTAAFPSVSNFIGSFGDPPYDMKLGNGGELIQLFDANNVLIDEVEYDDAAPWPTEPDGDGPTLQLTDSNLNNALASSWEAIPPTPGAVNGGGGLQDQTINFPPIADKLTTDGPFSISATATSGLTVSFNIVSGPATISGNTITLTGQVGTVIVEASQGGNGQFNPAPNVQQSFNVTAPGLQDQTISFSPISNKFTTSPPFAISAIASSGLSVSFTIISGPATVSGNTVTLTGQEGTVIVEANQGGNAQFNPAPSVQRSFNVTTQSGGGDPPTGYCDARGQQPWFEWIANVTFGDINNNSAKNGYGNFLNLSTDINQGGSYVFNVTPAFSWTQRNVFFKVWIDFNRDGDFDDAGEEAYAANRPAAPGGTPIQAMVGTIQVPSGASLGFTRMRVAMKRDISPLPCETFDFGEVEDYLVNIQEGSNGSTINLTCPNNITVTAQPGANSAVVTWNSPTGSSDCPTGGFNIQQVTGLSSGSNFPLGNTDIVFQASDDCGSLVTCSFTVSVQSSNANLTLTCPSNATFTAPSGSNSGTVNWTVPTPSSTCTVGSIDLQQLAGPVPGSSMPIGTETVTYQATDGCGNVETCSFTVTVESGGGGGNPPSGYCESRGTSPWQQWIANVNFGSIDNSSGKNRYGDFTNLSTLVNPGNNYNIILTPGFSWTQWDEYFRVWIDYNRDGDFEDAGEEAFSAVRPAGTPPNVTPVNGLITIPNSASNGLTRMRVSMQRDAYAGPCEVFSLGEVEDYLVNIQSGGNLVTGDDERLNLRAYKGIQAVKLQWLTNTEIDNDYFVIERSTDGQNFEVISEQMSLENDMTLNEYEFFDEYPKLGANHYQIRQIQYDGTSQLSEVRTVLIEHDVVAYTLFPNPAKEDLYISLREHTGKAGAISIYNHLGHVVMERPLDVIPHHPIHFDLRKYVNGLYTIRVKVEDRRQQSSHFVINRLY